MSEVPFHATVQGRHYYEHSLPELLRQLKRVGDGLERLIELHDSADTANQQAVQELESTSDEEPTRQAD